MHLAKNGSAIFVVVSNYKNCTDVYGQRKC